MNKSEMVAAIAERANLSKKDAEKALVAFIEETTNALKNGEKVQLVGFGSFEVKTRCRPEGPQSPDQGRDYHSRLQGPGV